MSTSLAPDIAAGRAKLQPEHHGVSVTLVDESLFAYGGSELSEAGRNILTGVIQALLDPRILRIELAETEATPRSLQAARVQTVARYFNQADLGPAIQPPGPMQADAAGTGRRDCPWADPRRESDRELIEAARRPSPAS